MRYTVLALEGPEYLLLGRQGDITKIYHRYREFTRPTFFRSLSGVDYESDIWLTILGRINEIWVFLGLIAMTKMFDFANSLSRLELTLEQTVANFINLYTILYNTTTILTLVPWVATYL